MLFTDQFDQEIDEDDQYNEADAYGKDAQALHNWDVFDALILQKLIFCVSLRDLKLTFAIVYNPICESGEVDRLCDLYDDHFNHCWPLCEVLGESEDLHDIKQVPHLLKWNWENKRCDQLRCY